MRVGGLRAWERALELYDGAKLDLALATTSAAFAGLATLDAHYSWFWSARQVAGLLAFGLGSGAALLGVRAGHARSGPRPSQRSLPLNTCSVQARALPPETLPPRSAARAHPE